MRIHPVPTVDYAISILMQKQSLGELRGKPFLKYPAFLLWL